MWLGIWETMRKTLNMVSHREVTTAPPLLGMSVVIDLSASVLSATSVLEATAIPGVASQIAEKMNALVNDVIKPFLAVMVREKNERLTWSVLNMIMVWTELHFVLSSTPTGYVNASKHPIDGVTEPLTKNPLASIPFLDEGHISYLREEFNSEGDANRSILIGLLVQKISFATNRNQEFNKYLRKYMDFIFEKTDLEDYPNSTNAVAYHIPILVQHMGDGHVEKAIE